MHTDQIFISYRRDGGAELARLIRDNLAARGYKLFMDVEDLRNGPFNTALLEQIEKSKDIILILSPNSLDRCVQPDDWIRLEVSHAIQQKKNIIPVVTRGFKWPETPLPDDLASLKNYQALNPSHEFFTASMEKLEKMLTVKPQHLIRTPVLKVSAIILLMAIVAAIPGYAYFNSKDRLVRAAVDRKNEKDYAGAFHYYCRASDRAPSDLELHRQIEECVRKCKTIDLTNALLRRYTQLVDRQSNNVIFNNYLGNSYLMQGNLTTAEKYYLIATHDDTFAPPFLNLGILRAKNRKYDEALVLFEKYASLCPNDIAAWINIGTLYVLRLDDHPVDGGVAASATNAYHKALSLEPKSARALKGLGRVSQKLGQKESAIKWYELSLASDWDQEDLIKTLKEMQDIPDLASDFETRSPGDPLRQQKIRMYDLWKSRKDKDWHKLENDCNALIKGGMTNEFVEAMLKAANGPHE